MVTLRAAVVVSAVVVAAATATTVAGASGRTAARTPAVCWRPDVRAAVRYARHRRGDIAFAVRTRWRLYAHRGAHRERSASVVKAMLLVAYLDRPQVRRRALRPGELAMLARMIRRSDNQAATAVRDMVGNGALRRLARKVGMRRFAPRAVWGDSLIDADDQTRLFLAIDRFVARRHRSTAMRLLRSIVPSQRWGIARVRPHGWALYFKGGWGSGVGLVDHQVALLRRGPQRVAIAMLTLYDGSHGYGIATLRGLALRLTRGLGPHAHVDDRRCRGFHRRARRRRG